MPSAPKKTATKAKAPAPKKKAAPAASAFNKPLTPSKELAAVVGAEPLPRTEVVSKVWVYIKKHKLQNPANKREKFLRTTSFRLSSARRPPPCSS